MYSPGDSEFKHKGVKGIIVNMHEFVGKHKLSIREKIKAQYKKFMEYTSAELDLNFEIEPVHLSSHNVVLNGHPKM